MTTVSTPRPTPLVLHTIVCLAAAFFVSGCDGSKKSGQQGGGRPAPTVTVAKPLKKQIVEWDRYTGRFEAVDEVEIQAKVSGYLDSIHFVDGQMVDEGDLLFVIQQRPFQSEVDRAEASLSVAKANETRAKAGVQEAEAQLDQATAAAKLAEIRLERTQRLKTQGAVPQEELDTRVSERDQAQADVEAASAAIALAKAQVDVASAEVKSAESSLRTANIQLGYTEIRSPIKGRVSRHNAAVGNLINGGAVGATVLTSVVSVDPIHVYFDANEAEFLKYVRLDKSGQRPGSRDTKNPVLVKLADETGYPHEGHMDFVDNQLDSETGTMLGRAILPNPDDVLTPGLFATVPLPGSSPYEAILIPDEAVATDQTTQLVYVIEDVDGESTAVRRPVVTGGKSLGLRIIKDGLDGSETVAIRGIQALRDGAKVQTEPGEIVADENPELPTDYKPWPRERWLGPVAEGPSAKNEEDVKEVSDVSSTVEVVPPQTTSQGVSDGS